MKTFPQPLCGGRMCVVPFRAWPWLLLLLVAACSVQHTPVPVPEGVDARFTIEQGNSPAEAPPDASIRAITPLEVATSLRGAEKSLNVAVEQSYAFPDQVIEPGQEVAIFPPVSGG